MSCLWLRETTHINSWQLTSPKSPSPLPGPHKRKWQGHFPPLDSKELAGETWGTFSVIQTDKTTQTPDAECLRIFKFTYTVDASRDTIGIYLLINAYRLFSELQHLCAQQWQLSQRDSVATMAGNGSPCSIVQLGGWKLHGQWLHQISLHKQGNLSLSCGNPEVKKTYKDMTYHNRTLNWHYIYIYTYFIMPSTGMIVAGWPALTNIK